MVYTITEAKLFALTTQHPDAKEGTMAFFEKRAPEWKGSPTKEWPEALS